MLCKRCPHLVRHGQLGADKKTIEFRNLCGLRVKQQLATEQAQTEASNARKGAKKAAAKANEARPSIPPSAMQECVNFPFPDVFDYIECNVYQSTFKSSTRKNDVIPTKDFQYSDALSGTSITDMELL